MVKYMNQNNNNNYLYNQNNIKYQNLNMNNPNNNKSNKYFNSKSNFNMNFQNQEFQNNMNNNNNSNLSNYKPKIGQQKNFGYPFNYNNNNNILNNIRNNNLRINSNISNTFNSKTMMNNFTNNNFNNNNFNVNYNNINNNAYNNNFNNNNFSNNNFNNNNNSNNNNNNNFNNNKVNNEFNYKTTIVKKKYDILINFMVRARGLENVGATCYMNATLQCFYHVKPLTENLINDNNIKKSMEITYCYKNLIEELTNCKKRDKYKINLRNYNIDEKMKDYVKPQEFKDLISKKNSLFKGIKANDSKDLIIFLLEGMDEELTKRNNKTDEKVHFYGKDKSDMIPENFKKIHNSIFADLFYGFKRSIMECKSCGHVDETFSVFNFLIFPLEKIYNSLNQNNNGMNINNFNMNNMNIMNNMHNMYNMNNIAVSNNYFNFKRGIGNQNPFNMPTTIIPSSLKKNLNNFNNNINNNNSNNIKRIVNLDDCFKEDENEEILSGDNQIFCNYCNQSSDARTKYEIYKAPNVLILIINRGRGNVFECDLDFPIKLDISKFINNQESPKIYNLIGVISHLGKSSMEGHFIAYCKHFDDTWYIFNDAFVNPVDNNNIYKGTPYILFYQNENID